ncbi:unnamed protein product [Haemonchus placei]|uniref:Uncharacterized protein n=1 Tax=Haemonchus placei TaxID=6290 RepID=A0A3P7WHF9_HAEPC|nr:unnamed protein product [Haemonchus placei]
MKPLRGKIHYFIDFIDFRSDTARSFDEGHRLLENTVTMLERQLRRSDNRIQELERLCELQQVSFFSDGCTRSTWNLKLSLFPFYIFFVQNPRSLRMCFLWAACNRHLMALVCSAVNEGL